MQQIYNDQKEKDNTVVDVLLCWTELSVSNECNKAKIQIQVSVGLALMLNLTS